MGFCCLFSAFLPGIWPSKKLCVQRLHAGGSLGTCQDHSTQWQPMVLQGQGIKEETHDLKGVPLNSRLDDFKFQPRDLNNFGWEGLKGTAKSPPRSSPQCLIKSDVSIYLTHSKIPATTSCPRTRLGSAQKEAAAYFQPLNNMVHAMISISHLLWVFRLNGTLDSKF